MFPSAPAAADDQYQRIALAFQRAEASGLFSGFSSKVPVAVLVGLQSAGKTSTLQYLAGRVIGGAIERNIGTRCPVRYEFRNTAGKHFSVNGTSVERPEEISRQVTRVMRSLGDAFTDREVVVRINSPQSRDLTVVDLPGLRPQSPGEPDRNGSIRSMFERYLSDTTAIPLIVGSLNTRDADDACAAWKSLRHAIDPRSFNDNRVPPCICRGLVFISNLDSLNQMEHPTALLRSHLEAVRDGLGLTEEKLRADVYVASTKPHLYNPGSRDTTLPMDHAEFDIDAENTLLSRALQDEEELLPRLLRRINLGNFGNFGMRPLLTRVTNISRDYVRDNLSLLIADFNAQCKLIIDSLHFDMNVEEMYEGVREHTRYVISSIKACAQGQELHCAEPNHTLRDKIPPTSYDKMRTFRADHLVQTADSEMEAAARFLERPERLNFLKLAELRRSMDRQSALFKSLGHSISAGQLALRVLQLVGYFIVTHPLREYSIDQIRDYCKGVTAISTAEESVMSAVREMFRGNIADFGVWLGATADWIASIYIRMFIPVAELVDGFGLLPKPRLRKYFNDLLHDKYQGFFKKKAKELTEEVAKSALITFDLLDLRSIFHPICRLGVCKISDFRALVSGEGELSFTERTLPNGAPPPTLSGLHEVLGSLKPEDFVAGPALKLKASSGAIETIKYKEEIRRFVNALTRERLGMLWELLVQQAQYTIIKPAMMVHDELEHHMADALQELRADDYRELKKLSASDEGELERFEDGERRLTALLELGACLAEAVDGGRRRAIRDSIKTTKGTLRKVRSHIDTLRSNIADAAPPCDDGASEGSFDEVNSCSSGRTSPVASSPDRGGGAAGTHGAGSVAGSLPRRLQSIPRRALEAHLHQRLDASNAEKDRLKAENTQLKDISEKRDAMLLSLYRIRSARDADGEGEPAADDNIDAAIAFFDEVIAAHGRMGDA